MSSVQVETIGTDSKDIAMQEASLDIWDKKYRLKSKTGEVIDHTIDDTYKRVARAIADVEQTKELREHWYERFLWAGSPRTRARRSTSRRRRRSTAPCPAPSGTRWTASWTRSTKRA